ncbi:MAG TPA: hypothetical protein VHZ52_09920 [Acidobacteriaceae bacterium]|nr:hypothetical protein [Acidobacteriaceae bacterium]
MFCALAALSTAGVLAGCGNNFYFAGRVLPPSGIANRVLIAVQNPSPATKGLLEFVDAFYDIRQSYNDKIPNFSISGYSGALPATIQNMPEEQVGAVYGSGDGSLTLINYQKETTTGSAATLNGLSSSVFIARSGAWVIAASQQSQVLTVANKATGATYALNLPGVYRVSMNPGGSVMMAFVQNSNYAYYPRKLTSVDSTALAAYYLANQTWPAPYTDCEPKNLPAMCVAQVQDPSGNPINFDRPVKALFSSDGSSAYILSCGPECGGNASSVSVLPVAPLNVVDGEQTGSIPSQSALTTIAVPGGASNALENGTTLYVLGQQLMPDGFFGGNLTVIDLTSNKAGSPVSVSDSAPGQRTRMILGDNNTLWLGGIRCTEGERYNNPSSQLPAGSGYGCLTMFDTSSNTVKLLEPYQGDLTGIAAVTGLNKVYVAAGGQVYIYTTTDGSAINNFYVTVTGTAYDVAYMDAVSDGNNTVY